MRWKQADFLAGSFVVAGAALIIAMFVIVRGSVGAPDRYHTFFDNVAGLRAGATVVYEGYIIGSVEEVQPIASEDGMQFRVNLAVEQGWKIPEDSIAEISAVSLLSANAIQIRAGIGNPMPVDSEIRSMKAANIMADISKTADELTEIAQSHLAPLLGTLRNVLNVEGRDALSSVATLTNELAERTPAIMKNIEDASENVAGIAGGDNAASISRTISNIETASSEVASATSDAADIVTETETVVTKALAIASQENIDRITGIIQRVDSSAQQLETMLESANRSTRNVEAIVGPENRAHIGDILMNLKSLQDDVQAITKVGMTSSKNIEQITEFSEDRLEGFLLRMESAALNIEEMTARLRNDPSLLILGSE